LSKQEFTFTSLSEVTSVVVDLTEKEEGVIRAYREEYRRLANSSISKKELPCGLSIRSAEAVPVKVTLPSEDDIAILLHRLRPFILQEEPASFYKTTAILGRRLPKNAVIRAFLRELRREWKGERFFDEIAVFLQSVPIDGEKLLLDWLNALEYHRDPHKAASVRELRMTLSEPIADFIIVSLALDKVKAVRKAGTFSRLILGELRTITIEGGRLQRRGA
jgi:hypothetical protein